MQQESARAARLFGRGPDRRGAAGLAMVWPGAGEDAVGLDEAVERIMLPLRGLQPDANGNVVLLDDAGSTAVGVITREKVTLSGMVDRHVTAGGIDVAGFCFVRFESGVTLYYPVDTDMVITSEVR